MTKTEQQARELLLTLTPEERRRVIASVQQSSPSQFDPAWDPEIERRLAEIDAGKVEMIPHDEIMRRVRAKAANAQEG